MNRKRKSAQWRDRSLRIAEEKREQSKMKEKSKDSDEGKENLESEGDIMRTSAAEYESFRDSYIHASYPNRVLYRGGCIALFFGMTGGYEWGTNRNCRKEAGRSAKVGALQGRRSLLATACGRCIVL